MNRIEEYITGNISEDTCILDENGKTSYRDINYYIYNLYQIIKGCKLNKGERVIVLCSNGRNAIVSLMAVLCGNLVAVPIDIQTPVEVVFEMIGIINAKVIIHGDDYKNVNELKSKFMDIAFINVDECELLNYLCCNNIYGKRDSSDPAIILFTSGTTGKMKAVVHSHETIINNIHSVDDYMNISKEDIFYIIKTYVHCSSLLSEILLAFSKGASVCLYKPKVSLSTIMKRIKNEKATILGINPTFLRLILQMELKDNELSSVRIVASSGAILHEEVLKKSKEVFQNAKIINVYGLTEAGPRVSAERPDGTFREGSVGKPIKDVYVKILQEDGPKAPGEILIKSNSIMLGYYNDTDSTDMKMQDGWLRTGDVGYIDNDGFLFVVGRKDDMINRGSHNVAPMRIENVINRIPGIKQCVVFGVSDLVNGNNIVCGINSDKVLSATVIMKECKKYLYEYEIPQVVVFWDSIPSTLGGKVSRKLAKEKYENEKYIKQNQ